MDGRDPSGSGSNSTMGKTENDVLERDKIVKKKNSWLKWGISAVCLCFAIGVLFWTKAAGTKGKDTDILEDAGKPEEPSPLVDTENLLEVTMNDVLGFDVCHVKQEGLGPYSYMWHFYVKVDGEDVCVAEQFGYEGLEAWSRDLDGDGVPELICNVTFGDGVQSVIVYRNNNGIIEEGSIRWSYYEEQFGWTHVGEGGISGLPVVKYDPEQDVFTATDYHTGGFEDPVTVEFHDGFTPFDFSAFSHQP